MLVLLVLLLVHGVFFFLRHEIRRNALRKKTHHAGFDITSVKCVCLFCVLERAVARVGIVVVVVGSIDHRFRSVAKKDVEPSECVPVFTVLLRSSSSSSRRLRRRLLCGGGSRSRLLRCGSCGFLRSERVVPLLCGGSRCRIFRARMRACCLIFRLDDSSDEEESSLLLLLQLLELLELLSTDDLWSESNDTTRRRSLPSLLDDHDAVDWEGSQVLIGSSVSSMTQSNMSDV